MKPPFTVFHIDGERGLRGGERQLLYLACALRRRGHRNIVVCREAAPLSAEAARLGLERLALPFLSEFDPFSASALRRAAARAPRPLLHAHTAHAASLATMAGAWGGAPSVMHRRVDFPFAGRLSRALKYDRAGKVIAVSAAVKEVVLEGGIKPERVCVVPDGVPADAEEAAWAGVPDGHFAPALPEEKARLREELAFEFGLPLDAAWVGNLAALVPHKDHDALLAAALIVLWRRPKTVFLVGGEGPEKPRLLETIRRLGLLGRFVLLGQRRDPFSLLKALDVFVLSSWGEGMGSVLLEAASCALPIAATRAGGIPEVVDEGRGGLLSPVRDPEALAASILRLLEDPAEAERLSRHGRESLRRFGLARMGERMEEIYRDVA